MRKEDDWKWNAATAAMNQSNWSSISHTDYVDEVTLGYETILYDEKNVDPAIIVENKQAWESLSTEAREIVRIIFSCPGEIIEIYTPKHGNVSLAKLTTYLKKHHWRTIRIRKAFEEIRKALREW